MRAARVLGLITLLVSLVSTSTAAQDGRSAAVGGTVSAINMDSHTSWSIAASFEYRFNRVAGLEVETTFVPTLESSFDVPVIASSSAVLTSITPGAGGLNVPAIFPSPSIIDQHARAVMFTNNVRVHVPTTTDRIDPYFVAGGGASNVRRTATIVFSPLPIPVAELTALGIVLPPTLIRSSISEPLRSSSTALALTIGGGLGVRVTSRLSVEGDLRMFRLLETDDQNVGRFGVGARFRF